MCLILILFYFNKKAEMWEAVICIYSFPCFLFKKKYILFGSFLFFESTVSNNNVWCIIVWIVKFLFKWVVKELYLLPLTMSSFGMSKENFLFNHTECRFFSDQEMIHRCYLFQRRCSHQFPIKPSCLNCNWLFLKAWVLQWSVSLVHRLSCCSFQRSMTQPCLVRWNAFAWKNYCFFIAVCGGSFKQRTLKKSRWLDWIFFPWPVQLLWYCVQSCQLQNAMLLKGNRIVYPKRWGARCCLQEKELTASCRTNTIGATQHRLERPAVKGAISMHPAKAAPRWRLCFFL